MRMPQIQLFASPAGELRISVYSRISITFFMPKSIEKMDKQPKQPKEAPTPQESYNKKKWGEIKKKGYAAISIDEGRKMGVPQEELDEIAQEFIARRTKEERYDTVYNFMRNTKIGTEEEIKSAGEQAYKFFFEKKKYSFAISIAKDVYGKDSEEWKRVDEAIEATQEEKEEEEEKEEVLLISKDATFAEFFNALDDAEEGGIFNNVNFEDKLNKKFDPIFATEVLAFRDLREKEARTTNVLDFFKKHGYSQKDISIFLPIKFKRERKKQ